MKLVKAIIRPEKEAAVVRALEEVGIWAMSKWDVLGRGRQRGIQVGPSVYEELPKQCLLLVVEDEQVQQAVDAITDAARTGSPGDGRIFVSAVETAYTVRTGRADG